ncbi:MAG: 4Fe-4S binding protein [Desulfovibrio sp.]|nr:4Fe-4S binding protein [Desulfovibrio sp.]
MKSYTVLRRTSQLLVVFIFCFLPWAPSFGLTGIMGSLFALEIFGLPFADPVNCLGVLATWTLPKADLLLGAGLALVLALFFGRVFCSFLCPYGFFSELVSALSPRKMRELPFSLEQAFYSKVGLLLLALLCLALFSWPLPSLISFPGSLSLLPLLVFQGSESSLLLSVALLPLIMLLLEGFTGQRLWCRYFCPQAVLLGLSALLLPKRLPGLRLSWDPRSCSCRGASPCQTACTLELKPRHIRAVSRRDCTNCGDCLKACAKNGQALSINIKSKPY